MTDTTITIDPAIAGLDLRPLVALREPAAALTARLEAGDRTAIDDARTLVDRARAITTAAEAALVHIGAIVDDSESHRTIDALHELIGEIGVGNLEFWLDVVEGRCPHPDEPDTEMLAYVAEHREGIEAWIAPHRRPAGPIVDLGGLVALRPDIEAMTMRLLAHHDVPEAEFEVLVERQTEAARALVAAVASAYTPGDDDQVLDIKISDGLNLAAERISGMWSLSVLWDQANEDEWTHRTVLRLLKAKHRDGATRDELWAYYGELANAMSDEARDDVAAWLRQFDEDED